MTTPHLIRLRGPWQCEPSGRGTLSAEDAPCVRCTRRFNAPTNLDADEHVWLICDEVEHRARFTLNGHDLGMVEGPCPQPRFDLTKVLQPHNVLVIDVELATDEAAPPAAETGPLGLPGGIGEVRLEIGKRAADWKIEKFDPR
jgi:hypothetical protein